MPPDTERDTAPSIETEGGPRSLVGNRVDNHSTAPVNVTERNELRVLVNGCGRLAKSDVDARRAHLHAENENRTSRRLAIDDLIAGSV